MSGSGSVVAEAIDDQAGRGMEGKWFSFPRELASLAR